MRMGLTAALQLSVAEIGQQSGRSKEEQVSGQDRDLLDLVSFAFLLSLLVQWCSL